MAEDHITDSLALGHGPSIHCMTPPHLHPSEGEDKVHLQN